MILAEAATTTGGMGITQWILLGFIVLLLIAYPIFMSRRNKRENQKVQEQANSLKRGDEIITSSGVYGKVLEVKQEGEAKKVVIETGSDKNKSYLTIDAYCVYAVLNKETKEPAKAEEKEEKKEDKKAVEKNKHTDTKKEASNEEKTAELDSKQEESVKAEEKPKAKKKESSNKK